MSRLTHTAALRTAITAIAVVAMSALSWAGSPHSDIKANPKLSASGSVAYPDADLPRLTPAPAGYRPFYISHYGRHGSRYFDNYREPLASVERANRHNFLTSLGKSALSRLREIARRADGRAGDLTALGARQHQGIARRMFRNFPEVFAGNGKKLQARSTVYPRCVLSMTNETGTLNSLNPYLDIHTDASQADMGYMMYGTSGMSKVSTLAHSAVTAYTAAHTSHDKFVARLISDSTYAHDSISGSIMMRDMFAIASIQQNQDDPIDLYDLFTDDEIYALWDAENVSAYTLFGNAPVTKGLMPYSRAPLLHKIIADADKAIAGGEFCADLRFGHDMVVGPLACLLELDSCGVAVSGLEQVSNHWHNYCIYPMASNIQLVFYRKRGSSDTLVKALLNEHEATLPVKTDMAPYYHWSDVRAYYISKLTKLEKSFNQL